METSGSVPAHRLHRGTFHPIMTAQLYMVIDFECFQPNVWQSVGIILYSHTGGNGGGHLVKSFHTACDRGTHTRPSSTAEFWKRHPEAFVYNVEQGAGRETQAEEIRICQFIDSVKREFPLFYLISDVPEYDIGLMDDILLRNGSERMSHRNDHTYLRSVCTWSSRRMLKLLGVSVAHHVLVVPPTSTPLHTPIVDCCRILNEYLCTLRAVGRQRLYTKQHKSIRDRVLCRSDVGTY